MKPKEEATTDAGSSGRALGYKADAQTRVRAPQGNELRRIQRECRRMNVALDDKSISTVLYAASLVYGNCDEYALRDKARKEVAEYYAKAGPAV